MRSAVMSPPKFSRMDAGELLREAVFANMRHVGRNRRLEHFVVFEPMRISYFFQKFDGDFFAVRIIGKIEKMSFEQFVHCSQHQMETQVSESLIVKLQILLLSKLVWQD